MLKSPITKEGNIRYFEVVKYTILIALLFVGYSTVSTVGLIPVLLGGLQISSIIVVVFIFNISFIAFLEIINVLHKLIEPIIKYIQSAFIVTVDRVTYLIKSTVFEYTYSYKTLNVFRC